MFNRPATLDGDKTVSEIRGHGNQNRGPSHWRPHCKAKDFKTPSEGRVAFSSQPAFQRLGTDCCVGILGFLLPRQLKDFKTVKKESAFSKVYYVIDWSDFTCTKRSLDTSFVPIQVPPNAQLMAQVFMGSSSSWGMGVLVNTWFGEQPGGEFVKFKKVSDCKVRLGRPQACGGELGSSLCAGSIRDTISARSVKSAAGHVHMVCGSRQQNSQLQLPHA
ncbi:hypothetical protein CRUP_035964 [Coryphaenoides rupestris]|nr:hypothetical protein CRUP_035964 [Coryphaenoides rupestris]